MKLCKVMAQVSSGWQETIIDLDSIDLVVKPTEQSDIIWVKMGREYIGVRADYNRFVEVWVGGFVIADLMPVRK